MSLARRSSSHLPLVAPLLLAALLQLVLAEAAHGAGPYYARGAYYAGTGDPWSYDAGNQLHDDGLHGDGNAGDGVYGAFVVSDQPGGAYGFKIANADWSDLWPHHPDYVLSNAVVWTLGPGDVVHFRLDTNVTDGWQPAWPAVATDQYAPPFTPFELIGSAPATGAWNFGVPAKQFGALWRATLTIATPGSHEFKFRAAGTWDVCNFGVHYNMFIGENFTYATTIPDSEVLFEMDTATGRGRAVELATTRAPRSTWGRVKALYR